MGGVERPPCSDIDAGLLTRNILHEKLCRLAFYTPMTYP